MATHSQKETVEGLDIQKETVDYPEMLEMAGKIPANQIDLLAAAHSDNEDAALLHSQRETVEGPDIQKETVDNPEMVAIAREIPANQIGLLGAAYLDIDDTVLSHIRHETADNSVYTNFKCLLHWYRNTEEPNKRQALYHKLKKAAKDGLVSEAGVKVVENSYISAIKNRGKGYIV